MYAERSLLTVPILHGTHTHTGDEEQPSVLTSPSWDVHTRTHTLIHSLCSLSLQAGSARITPFDSHSTSPKFSVSPSLGRCAHSASRNQTPAALTSRTECSGPRKTAPLQVGKAMRLRKGSDVCASNARASHRLQPPEVSVVGALQYEILRKRMLLGKGLTALK